MTQIPLVSIIIPVYNAELWLERCLKSALDQTISNIEVIAVDDGSSDGSRDILRAFAARDSRLRILINEKNCGQAAARNRGMDNATGTWLAFLDNDDMLSPDFCQILLAEAEKSGADIIKGRARIFEVNGEVNDTPLKCHQNIMQKSPLYFTESWWTAIYRRDKINGKVQLHENMPLAEDLIFLVEAISLPLDVVCVDKIVYFHNRRSKSGAERDNRSLKKIEASIDAGISILRILNERKIYLSDPTGYRVWAREALSWLGGYHRAKNKDRCTALQHCLTRSPQISSLILCDYPGIRQYLMKILLKILKDDKLMLARRIIFHSYNLIKK